ncbi:hypothetical protein H0I39_03525 [Ottowia beijingensis]|uniref:Glycosyl hydrolases family 43 n=1 Tax=Ottowia beijingensis TaxID=1207057 RepID=A0A853IWP1_9BURK|nr:hypothetical protein [Ottowia beijingensis]NZA01068.1 hypothetical protein [Ottowia beijingensis]
MALAALVGAGAQAANAPFPTVTTPVKLDTRVLASASWYEALNTIVYEAGTYHMWYVNPDLTGVRHATSSDGINFTTLGATSPCPPTGGRPMAPRCSPRSTTCASRATAAATGS